MIGIDNGIRLLQEPIDSTDLVEIFLPLRGMLDHNPEIDILVLRLYLPGDLLAVGGVQAVGRAGDYVTTHSIVLGFILFWVGG